MVVDEDDTGIGVTAHGHLLRDALFHACITAVARGLARDDQKAVGVNGVDGEFVAPVCAPAHRRRTSCEGTLPTTSAWQLRRGDGSEIYAMDEDIGQREGAMGHDSGNGATRKALILVVYGESPRSMRARENIRKALDARGLDPRTIKTVDVMTEPERALELRMVSAPQLIVGDLRSDQYLHGDLSDRECLDRWLDEMLEPAAGDPSIAPCPFVQRPDDCQPGSRSSPDEDT